MASSSSASPDSAPLNGLVADGLVADELVANGAAAYCPAADRILVIRLGALGDVVRTLPSVKALRGLYPGAHLTWLVEPGALGAVRGIPWIDETLVFPRADLVDALQAGDLLRLYADLRRFLLRLRRRRFDMVLDFHGILKSGILARLSGAPIRFGYSGKGAARSAKSGGEADRGGAREFSEVFMNRHVAVSVNSVSRYARNLALVQALAPSAVLESHLRLEASPVARARLTARLRVSGREDAHGFVLIHPGASRGARYKRYPADAWARVARSLAAEGHRVWLASGVARDERSLVDRILRESGGAAVAAPETRTFDDLLALISRSALFASGDTGPLHVASLAGIPVVQLLGPTHPVQNEPWAETPWRRVHVPIPCSPCRRGCLDASCMTVITPDAVAQSILELLAETAHQGTRPQALASSRTPEVEG